MNQNTKVNILSFMTVFLWASAFPLTKVALSYYTPNALGFIRCAIASIFLIVIGKSNHIRLPEKKDIPWFFLSGGLGFTFYMITFNIGIQTLTSATSSIIIATTPIMTAVIASFFFKERINTLGWFAILTAFVGVLILLLWEGVFSVNIGLIWTLGAATVFCGYNFLNRKLSAMAYSALEIVTYSMCSGAILLSVFAPQGISQIITAEPNYILLVIYLGMMPSAMAYFFWGKALSLAKKTTDVTNFLFVSPLLSTILGFILLQEVPNMGTFIGGAIIIFSLILFNLKGK
ncbi:EamA family transporter [Acetobacterium fimetarium]|uniref:EamA family transporter n=1 Tax=Acetobacterium fimetarium TaxID=52691 RepID=A0ABR6WXH2_9FIRM|nr:DMT family transporter [Acetobacterium fimetarium]MBC3805327.1 EamA family transporter [Acetobacterium fimetarium]